jgi:hypothetical protein
MLTEYLGVPIINIFNNLTSTSNVAILGIKMLSLIETLHNAHIIHCNIKPTSFEILLPYCDNNIDKCIEQCYLSLTSLSESEIYVITKHNNNNLLSSSSSSSYISHASVASTQSIVYNHISYRDNINNKTISLKYSSLNALVGRGNIILLHTAYLLFNTCVYVYIYMYVRTI